MKSDVVLDYAAFQLSPKRTRCELIVSNNGRTEKLASGLVKPFVTHVKVVEEQFAAQLQLIKLEVNKSDNDKKWLTKGTLERVVRFVSTPEILELVNTLDAEMSQLEAARKIYSRGTGDQRSSESGGQEVGFSAAADATKKELVRAIDERLSAVKQELAIASARASAAGFNPDSISELHLFADHFGAVRLNAACTNFLSLCQRRADLIPPWELDVDERVVRSSCESDMSIDDSSEVPSDALGKRLRQASSNKNQQFTGQDSTSNTQPQNAAQKDMDEKGNKDDTSLELPPIQTTQSARRLSVQDRINMFENKKKDGSSSSSGSKPVTVKPELRRLSSDVSSAPAAVEKAVLRRWSGASDMSIDLNGEKDTNKESLLCTPSPTSSVSSATNSAHSCMPEDIKTGKRSSDIADSNKTENQMAVCRGYGDDGGSKHQVENQPSGLVLSGKKEKTSLKVGSFLKDDVGSLTQRKLLGDGVEQAGLSSQGNLPSQVKAFSGFAINKDPGTFEGQTRAFPYQVRKDEAAKHQEEYQIQPESFSRSFEVTSKSEMTNKVEGQTRAFPYQVRKDEAAKHQEEYQIQSESFSRSFEVTSKSEMTNKVEDTGMKEHLAQPQFKGLLGHTRSLSEQFDGGFGFFREAQAKGFNKDQMVELRSTGGEYEETGKNGLPGIEKLQLALEESTNQKIKFQKPVPVSSEQGKSSKGKGDEIGLVFGNGRLNFSTRKVSESQEMPLVSSASQVEQIQRMRQPKVNQELNDDLKIKANELEKLFAEHKLRIPGDQSSSRRTKPFEAQMEHPGSSQNKTSAASASFAPVQLPEKGFGFEFGGGSGGVSCFSTPPPMKTINNLGFSESSIKNFSDLNDSKGKFYERYMQKRDAKLREEWGSKRTEKEAKLKDMHDRFERSRSEMKAKLSGSADGQDTVSSTHLRLEKLRSFNPRSFMNREQPSDIFRSEDDDEELSVSLPENNYGQDILLSVSASGDAASRSTQSKRSLLSRNLPSSIPHASAMSRSAVKGTNSSSGKRRVANSLAQSVPDFSDFRKENTKPSSGVTKATRSHTRSYARTKTTYEDASLAKEEKAQRSQPLRKGSAGLGEIKDNLGSNDEDSVHTLVELEEQSRQRHTEKSLKKVDSRTFLKKGSGIGPGTGAAAAKMKALMASDDFIDAGNFGYSAFEADDSVDMVLENEEEKCQSVVLEAHGLEDNETPRVSGESCNSGKSVSNDCEHLGIHSQAGQASVPELSTSLASKFLGNSVLDSPGESPVSWNSRISHPFSYPHETSDVDASVDSPIGSPASWKSHSLVQTEVDAARMRKKWGSAQKPVLVANSYQNQSRKDMTKGFKRLLKFGRKSKGTESMADWISATTSEGDDDTEDGRDLANRSSEDPRKSRMGFSQSHSSDDVFMDRELLNEEGCQSSIPANFKLREDPISGSSLKAAPRSFFSLSNFRSKGSDAKLR